MGLCTILNELLTCYFSIPLKSMIDTLLFPFIIIKLIIIKLHLCNATCNAHSLYGKYSPIYSDRRVFFLIDARNTVKKLVVLFVA